MNELTELAKRLVASPFWRWLPGMLCAEVSNNRVIHRVLQVTPDGRAQIASSAPSETHWVTATAMAWSVPVLTDAATEGCLLRLVEFRYGFGCYVRTICNSADDEGAVVFRDDTRLTRPCQTRIHALVEALTAPEAP